MKSKEFLDYITNPVNLLSTYGYDKNMIIQIRNSFKNKENLDTLDNFIAKNKLISEKNIIKLESGRTNFSKEKKGSKFIKLNVNI